MERVPLMTCWNCATSQPAADFADGRCPACGARDYPNWVVLVLGLTFSGSFVGWIGGVCLGVVFRLFGWDDDVLTTASSGCLLGGLVFGWVGLCLAVLFAFARSAERRDEEVLRRGAEIRKARANRSKSETDPNAGGERGV